VGCITRPHEMSFVSGMNEFWFICCKSVGIPLHVLFNSSPYLNYIMIDKKIKKSYITIDQIKIYTLLQFWIFLNYTIMISSTKKKNYAMISSTKKTKLDQIKWNTPFSKYKWMVVYFSQNSNRHNFFISWSIKECELVYFNLKSSIQIVFLSLLVKLVIFTYF